MALSVFQVPAPFNSLSVATEREQHLISQTEWVCWVEISRQNKEIAVMLLPFVPKSGEISAVFMKWGGGGDILA